MYKDIHERMRTVDNHHILFYEPTVSDLDVVGFDCGPGGIEYNDRQAFAFHVYCSINDPHGDPRSKYMCHLEDNLFFYWREKNMKQLGGGYFLTEFGAVSDSPSGVNEISWILGQAEQRFISWAYWQFKYNADITTASRPGTLESFYDIHGNLQQAKVKALSRTYAQAICGIPRESIFNETTSDYRLVYIIGEVCVYCFTVKTKENLSPLVHGTCN